MVIFKKDEGKPTIDWELVDEVARGIYKILHDNKKITFLELDCILNLVTTECNNAKYSYLLSKKGDGVNEPALIKEVPGHLYG